MNPQIKNLAELDPSSATNLGPCCTDDPDIARKCAILTLDELEKLYVDTGKFDRAMKELYCSIRIFDAAI
jgi:hypothetical protein